MAHSGSLRRLSRAGGKDFAYVDDRTGRRVTDPAQLQRIRSLRIPPAYTDVVICKDAGSKVQAWGRDAKGRKQTVYNKEFVEAQRAKRFADLAGFDRTFARIKADVSRRLQDPACAPKDKLVALIVRLMIACHFRIGSLENVRKYNTFGLTTLQNRHAVVRETSVQFAFVGKKAQPNEGVCGDARVVAMIKALKRQGAAASPLFAYGPAGQQRTVSARDVNEYLQSFDPNITSKDIRTYEANRLFVRRFRAQVRAAQPASDTAWKKAVREAVKQVAHDLHNTPAVCRKDYLHSGLLEAAETQPGMRARLLSGE